MDVGDIEARACAKESAGRRYWMRQRVIQLTRFYLDEGGRPAAAARAQRAGWYEQIRGRWLLQGINRDGVLDGE